MLNLVIGGAVLTLALLGLFFLEDKKRRFLLGLWAGYALFGLYFNYHISTHDYYSLPLIPIAALSLAPLADWFLAHLAKLTPSRWLRLSAFCFLLSGALMSLWNTRTQLNSVDYRPETTMWAEIAEKVGENTLAGLTQDYGQRLAYWGWKNVNSWPTHGDLIYRNDRRGAQHDFESQFEELALTKDFFVVTDFTDLALQPFLEQKLSQYPIFAEGDGYVIYDLHE